MEIEKSIFFGGKKIYIKGIYKNDKLHGICEKFINGKGKLKKIENFINIYKKNLIEKNKIKKKIKAVVACGNGTAGIFAPDILKGIGCEVIEMDCNLDFNFPKYNPNPED